MYARWNWLFNQIKIAVFSGGKSKIFEWTRKFNWSNVFCWESQKTTKTHARLKSHFRQHFFCNWCKIKSSNVNIKQVWKKYQSRLLKSKQNREKLQKSEYWHTQCLMERVSKTDNNLRTSNLWLILAPTSIPQPQFVSFDWQSTNEDLEKSH